MKHDRKCEEASGLDKVVEGYASQLAAHAAQTWDSVEEASYYFTDPYAATLTAWAYEHHQNVQFVETLEYRFPEVLAAMCGCDPRQLYGESGMAFVEFMTCFNECLYFWRSEQPPEGLHGSGAAHWCERHPRIFSEVQQSLRSRATYPQVATVEWTFQEFLAFGKTGSVPKVDKLGLPLTVHFAGQRTWRQAAHTAALALFGDFLLTNESLAFCRHCEKPFSKGQKKLFCSSKCAHINSAIRSRDAATRLERRRTFKSASKELPEWLKGGNRLGSDWPKHFQNKFDGMLTLERRPKRTLRPYILASRTEPGSLECEKLFQSLQDSDTISGIQKETKSDWDVQPETFYAFLDNIRKAEKFHTGRIRK